MTSTRFDGIQVLRALAAIAVVLFHVPGVGVGQFGVDLFFVISGFIMCHVTERGNHGFLRKRIARVVPLYWLGTLAVTLAAILAPSLLGATRANLAEVVQSLLFIPFMKSNGMYPVLFLGWSLNFEMLFYGIMALAMVLSQRHRMLLTGCLVVVLVGTGMVVDTTIVPVIFYTQPIMMEFVLGIAAYALFRRLADRSATWPVTPRRLVALVVILAASVVMVAFDVSAQPLARPMVWGGSALVIVLASLLGWRDVVMPPWLVGIGDASYSLYLLHPYAIQGIATMIGATGIGTVGNVITAVGGVAGSIAIARLVYAYVERPLDAWLRGILLREKVTSDA